MFRIDTPNKAVDLFGAGKHGFRDGDMALGVNPTELSAAQQNALQEEILGVIEAAGVVPNKANNAQLVESIQRLIDAQSGNYALDTGAANAYVVALNPAIAAYTGNFSGSFKAAHANTGASTLDAGGGVIPLVNDVGGALLDGDIKLGSIITYNYIAADNKAYITSAVRSQFTARTIQKFTSGTGTYTTPAGCVAIKVRMVGGGGGGAGSGTGAAGVGGGGGGTGFGSVATANGGGGGNTSGSGAPGGTATLTAPAVGLAISGGRGEGGMYSASSTGANLAGGSGGATPFGGAGTGAGSAVGISAEANTGSGGGGGGSIWNIAAHATGCGGGAGGFIEAMIVSPAASYAYGVGAGGTAGAAGTTGYSGGAGGSGLIIVEEYYV